MSFSCLLHQQSLKVIYDEHNWELDGEGHKRLDPAAGEFYWIL
ncbi:MAG: hypothetical protein ACFB15_28505 [Cyclobacteriaceae bacterium]